MLTSIVTGEMSGRFRTENVFGLCVWTNSSRDWMDTVCGLRSIPNWGAVGFSTTCFSTAITYAGTYGNTLMHVWRFGVV